MFNSTNLPLEKKKITKKTLESLPGFILLFVVLFGGALGFNALVPEAYLWWTPILAFSLVFLYIFGVYIYQVYYYRLYFYDFKEDGAEVRKGVISQSTGHVRYERIQNIYVDQDILDRLFGLFDIHYETAGETSGIYSHVDGLNKENSDKLVNFLNERLYGVNNKDKELVAAAIPETPKVSIEATGEIIDRSVTPVSSRIIIMNSLVAFSSYILFIILFSGRLILDSTDQEFSPWVLIASVAVSVVLLFGTIVYYKIWYKNFYFQFSDNSGVVKSQVIALSNTYVYYDRIQNINVTQGIIERIFGLFSVTIETAAESNKKVSGSGLQIPGLSKDGAEKIKNFLLAKVDIYRHKL